MSAPENMPSNPSTLDLIGTKLPALPKKAQGAVLVYLEYLLLRYASPPSRASEKAWSAFSFASAMGMLDDPEGLDEGDIDYLEEWQ